MAMEGYDLVMLGILAAAALLGYFKGIVWQIAWIAGIAASGFVALRFSGPLAPFFGADAPWNRLIAMLALYVGTSLAVWLVFRVVSGAISAVHLSAFDRQLGLLFGLAKGVLLCIIVTFFAVTLAPAYRDQIVGSRSGRLVAELIVRADEILPPRIAEPVHPFVKQFEDQLARPAGGAFAPANPAQPSPLQAIWSGVTSAAAWTGGDAAAPAEQGGRAAVGGFAAPAAWSPQPPAWPAAQPAQPAGAAASGFQHRPSYQPPPGQFPIGAQTPIPMR